MTIEERINEFGEKYEKQKEINKELVDENEALKFAARMSEKTEKQLRKENAELKEEIDKKQHLADVRLEQELETYQKLHIKSKEKLDTEIALDEVKEQLTKAKALLAKWIELYKPKSKTVLPTPIQIDTEQFLKEIEK